MRNTLEKKQFPRTLADQIFQYLKESILNGKISPGQKIVESDLTELFGVSNSPVREAVRRLAGEGWITVSSHKEAFVKKLDYRELVDIYHVLISIDEMAIELIFERNPDILIAEMSSFLEKMEKVASKKTVEDYLALYADMYVRISELSGNDFLYKIRVLIKDQLAPYKPLRCFLFLKSDAIDSSMKEERALLKAIKSRDGRKIKHKARGRWIQYLPSEDEWKAYTKAKD